MKVYEDMKGKYILIRNPQFFKKGNEFMVYETEKEIRLIKLGEN